MFYGAYLKPKKMIKKENCMLIIWKLLFSVPSEGEKDIKDRLSFVGFWLETVYIIYDRRFFSSFLIFQLVIDVSIVFMMPQL